MSGSDVGTNRVARATLRTTFLPRFGLCFLFAVLRLVVAKIIRRLRRCTWIIARRNRADYAKGADFSGAERTRAGEARPRNQQASGLCSSISQHYARPM